MASKLKNIATAIEHWHSPRFLKIRLPILTTKLRKKPGWCGEQIKETRLDGESFRPEVYFLELCCCEVDMM